MVRKTKEEAEATRRSLLDAAEHVFHARGVAGTSLQHIAEAAGVTRGAVYWHFKDKAELFNAMMDRVCLPFEESTEALERAGAHEALDQLRSHLALVLERMSEDAQVRRVFEIAMQKVEYNDELTRVRERRLKVRADYLAVLERALLAARRAGVVKSNPPASQMAIGLHALLDGLVQNWTLDPGAFKLRTVGMRALDTYLAGLLVHPPQA
jgi:TetR/AcrR family transcriptional regulator, acrAB operon repressor